MKKIPEIQYVCVNIETQEVILTTNKQALSKFMKVTPMTLWRIIPKYGVFQYKTFLLWQNVEVIKGKQKGTW